MPAERILYTDEDVDQIVARRDERIAELEARLDAARDYYFGYAQDEAVDPEHCVDEKHHEAAKRFRDTVAINPLSIASVSRF